MGIEGASRLRSLHPAAVMSYVAALFLLALFQDHPLYLGGLLAANITTLVAGRGWAALKGWLSPGFFMALTAAAINSLASRAGETILLRGPRVPGLGSLEISLEAVLYGLTMGVRILALLTAFMLYNSALHPDRALGFVARWAQKSVFTVALATRLIPHLVHKVGEIAEVQRSRGLSVQGGGLWRRVAAQWVLLKPLLLTSLEGAWQIAEAMQARAFGSGRRTSYSRERFRPRDVLVLAASLLALGLGLLAATRGWSSYRFYPRAGPITQDGTQVLAAMAMMALLLVPATLTWGWQRCPRLRSRL